MVRQGTFHRLWCSQLCGCLLWGAAGCNWLKPLAFVLPEPKQTITAEFSHLEGAVAVVTWVPPETLYEYPNARLEVSAHVVSHLQANVDRALHFADVMAVEAYIEETGMRAVDPEAVAGRFDARYVVYLEVLEFDIRDPQVPEFLQGRIRASVVVYDLSDPDMPPRTYDLEPVAVLVPEHPVRFSQSNALVVRKAAYDTFAGKVAMKFYDHEEVIR